MLHRHSNKKVMPGIWMAPGGKLEKNEGLFECAKREILEETGLKIKNLRLKAVGNAYLKDLDLEFYFYFIVADWAKGKIVSELDLGELVWLTPKEIYKLDNLLSELKHVLPYVLDKTDKVISYKAQYEQGNEMTQFMLEVC